MEKMMISSQHRHEEADGIAMMTMLLQSAIITITVSKLLSELRTWTWKQKLQAKSKTNKTTKSIQINMDT